MSRGELHARHYATHEPVRVQWSDGVISRIQPTQDPPPENFWIAPGLFDVQINGYAGVDFQQDNLQLSHLLRAVQQLQQSGCTRILVTLVTDEWPKMISRLTHLRKL